MKNPFEDNSYYDDIVNPFEDSAKSPIVSKVRQAKTEALFKTESLKDKNKLRKVVPQKPAPMANITITKMGAKAIAKTIPLLVIIFGLLPGVISLLSDFGNNELEFTEEFFVAAKEQSIYKKFDMTQVSFMDWESVEFSMTVEEDYYKETSYNNKDYIIYSTYWFDDNMETYRILFINRDDNLEGVVIARIKGDDRNIDKQWDIGNSLIPGDDIKNYI